MVEVVTALAGLLILADHDGRSLAPANSRSPKYHRFDFEAACGTFVFRARFRNGPPDEATSIMS